MLIDILKGFFIGISASIPLGPIAIMVIQKSLSGGHKAGFITGLGACLVDTLFAVIAIFAWAYAQIFIKEYQEWILLIGGVALILIGLNMTFSNPFRKVKSSASSGISIKDFIQAVIMGITNPGAIVVIFTLFAFFGINVDNMGSDRWVVAPIILSVAAGAAFYWFVVSWGLSKFRKKINLRTILWINRITGAIVVIIGIALLGEGIYQLVFQNIIR